MSLENKNLPVRSSASQTGKVPAGKDVADEGSIKPVLLSIEYFQICPAPESVVVT